MDVRCEKCSTEFVLEDARVPDAGVRVKCSVCSHVFRVFRPAPSAPPEAAPQASVEVSKEKPRDTLEEFASSYSPTKFEILDEPERPMGVMPATSYLVKNVVKRSSLLPLGVGAGVLVVLLALILLWPKDKHAPQAVVEEDVTEEQASKKAHAPIHTPSPATADSGVALRAPPAQPLPSLSKHFPLVSENRPKYTGRPRTYWNWMAEADKARRLGQAKKALKAYQKASSVLPKRPEALVGRGFCLVLLDKRDEAESEFQKALKLNKKYAPASIGLAETQRLWGNKKDAVEFYENALKGLPKGEASDTVREVMETLKKQ